MCAFWGNSRHRSNPAQQAATFNLIINLQNSLPLLLLVRADGMIEQRRFLVQRGTDFEVAATSVLAMIECGDPLITLRHWDC